MVGGSGVGPTNFKSNATNPHQVYSSSGGVKPPASAYEAAVPSALSHPPQASFAHPHSGVARAGDSGALSVAAGGGAGPHAKGASKLLPSLLKSFNSFTHSLNLSIGNFISQAHNEPTLLPTFDNPASFQR